MKYFDAQDVGKIRRGFYSAVYFNRTKHILLKEQNLKVPTIQVFQKQPHRILCGMNEVVELLKAATGYFQGKKWISKWSECRINHVKEGAEINSGDTVMHLTGPYAYFAHLESLYLGILARRTLVATNTRRVVTAARGKPVIFFADRYDYFKNQPGDGYATYTGGAASVCTQAQASLTRAKATGTIPHALIALNAGDTVESTLLFAKHFRDERVIALVDFDNDCVGTSLKVAQGLGKKLWGVRLDTAENMIDKSLAKKKSKSVYGVNPQLVNNVRKALDKAGFKWIKIVVSGGFNQEKIAAFEKKKVPVDAYGVGSSLLQGSNPFTADVVMVDGKPLAKVGRKFKPIKP